MAKKPHITVRGFGSLKGSGGKPVRANYMVLNHSTQQHVWRGFRDQAQKNRTRLESRNSPQRCKETLT